MRPENRATAEEIRETVAAVYRAESRAVLATLIRLLGDFELAEEALHEAFRAALEQWPRDGVPDRPRAWLVSAGRFKAIDQLRRQGRFEPLDLARHDMAAEETASAAPDGVPDDRLRLVFTCCHPALAADAQVALTLREVCGLGTEEIAAAFLIPAPTLAQRIVRAKAKIRDARIPYEVPAASELPERLEPVLRVVYLVFNEGYAASSGASLVRHDLCAEAIRLARLLVELLPEPEAMGLLALMLLQDSRRAARISASGELALLDEQDRSLWNRAQIEEGTARVDRLLAAPPDRPVHAAGGHRVGARPSAGCRGYGLAPDRRPVRRTTAAGAISRHRTQPRGRSGDARWSGVGARPGGRVARARRAD
jgi:RNA polymerase sigma-70 factor (ECF subfamily)